MQDRIRSAFDKITLPAEADERIRQALVQVASQPDKEAMNMKKKHLRKMPKLAVALVAAVCVLTVSALALAISRVELVTTELDNGIYEVNFQSTDGDYVELGDWCPSWLPEGYELTFVSDSAGGQQTIHFETAEGQYIVFSVQKSTIEGGQMEAQNVTETRAVTIGDAEGVLYITKTGSSLFWTDAARGLGFALITEDKDVDLTAVAESVEELDEPLTPTLASGYDQALEDLGDYQITPPEGYEQTNFTASPLSDGGGWYAYVRYWYENGSHDGLYFSYESYLPDGGDNEDFQNTEEYVLSLMGGGASADITVNGHLAAAMEINGKTCLYWVDTENCLEFTLSADSLTADELVAIAEAMTLNG